ncbi:hypothetical protein Tco_1339673, partial [Tanacetum coccineum]
AEDPTDYPTDKDDDEEEEESSGDDANDEEEDEDEDKEEDEEHPALADSVPPPPVLLALPTPPPSPLTPLSSPLPQIPSSPLPASPTHLLGYIAAMIRTPPLGTTPLLPIPLPTSSPPLLLPSTDHKSDVPEVLLPPRKRLCIAPDPKYKIRESSSAPTARPIRGFRADYDEIVEETPTTDVAELSKRMTDFVTTIRHDTDEIYRRLDDAQDARAVLSGQLNLLRRDRSSHAHTVLLMEREARLSRQAWRQSLDANDTARSKVMALRTTVLAQQTEIGELWMAALQRQQRPAKDPTHPDVPEEAGSSS